MVDSEPQPVIGDIAPASFRDTQPRAATKLKLAPKPAPEPAPEARVVIAPPEERFLGASPWHVAGSASWYGPGLYGNTTACGQRYTKHIVGVAHRTLPCGTLVQLSWRGMTVVAPVIDRGPYGQASNVFDLSRALACEKLRP
ncbi:MAG: septal ring lytic transglycosylase RlpA family protein, partial [Candidatus Limnocylindrales bacterium]